MASAELALIQAIRRLDSGDFEAVPETLKEIWQTLSRYHGATSCAAEKMLLRILFKVMNGTNGEQVRRYPPAWNILGQVFSRVSAYSLAQALMQLHFIDLLKQTLKDLAIPQVQISSSEATGKRKRKRKRAGTPVFDLVAQREAPACLYSADALLQALNKLLTRCEVSSSERKERVIGSERLKSMFYTMEQNDFRETLASILALCNLALDRDELPDGHHTWVFVFVSLWTLHPRNNQEALETAICLSDGCVNILRKMRKISTPIHDNSSTFDAVEQNHWAQDIRRYLTRYLIMPLRVQYLSREDVDSIGDVVLRLGSAAPNFPIFFDLAINCPAPLRGKTAEMDNERWLQEVFNAIERSLSPLEISHRNPIMRTMLCMAVQHHLTLSLTSLRRVCEEYALRSAHADWDILLRLVELNVDVFLVPQNDRDILTEVLQQTKDGSALKDEVFNEASKFVASLARGFALARDYSGFLKTWLAMLTNRDPQVQTKNHRRDIWTQRELVFVVAELLQSSINTGQLRSILDWLESESSPSRRAHDMIIFEAIATGITRDDFIDTVGMRLFTMACDVEVRLPPTWPFSSQAARWKIAELSLSWSSPDECEQIWAKVSGELKVTLQKGALDEENTMAAFRCAAAAWIANHPNGKNETDAAALVCLLLGRLSNHTSNTTSYLGWAGRESPRLLRYVRPCLWVIG